MDVIKAILFGLFWAIIAMVCFAVVLTIVVGPIVYVCLPENVKGNLPQWLNVLCWVMILK